MKVFLDTGAPDDVAAILEAGFATGVTTNPSHLAAEAARTGRKHLDILQDIQSLLAGTGLPLSVQVMGDDCRAIIEEAEALLRYLPYDRLVVKVGCAWRFLPAVAELERRGVAVNCTCVMTPAQALLAAEAKASYVSFFWGKASDTGVDPIASVARIAAALHVDGARSQLIVGSIRRPYDVTEILVAGADIVTVGRSTLERVMDNSKSEEALALFGADYQGYA